MTFQPGKPFGQEDNNRSSGMNFSMTPEQEALILGTTRQVSAPETDVIGDREVVRTVESANQNQIKTESLNNLIDNALQSIKGMNASAEKQNVIGSEQRSQYNTAGNGVVQQDTAKPDNSESGDFDVEALVRKYAAGTTGTENVTQNADPGAAAIQPTVQDQNSLVFKGDEAVAIKEIIKHTTEIRDKHKELTGLLQKNGIDPALYEKGAKMITPEDIVTLAINKLRAQEHVGSVSASNLLGADRLRTGAVHRGSPIGQEIEIRV